MSQNQYEHLRIDCLKDVEPLAKETQFKVTDEREESIIIYTAKFDGKFVYGYDVYWANGKHSCQQPSATLGLFKTQREAELYAVGFMLLYVDYFTETTKEALRRAEHTLSQATLF